MKRQAVLLCEKNVARFLESFDTILADCDGVIWRGETPIAGAAEVVQRFVAVGKKIIYVTNNCTKSRKAYLEKFLRLGYPASEDGIVTAASATAAYLKRMNFTKTAYTLGAEGLCEELGSVGIRCIGPGPDPVPADGSDLLEYVQSCDMDPDVGAVVVGYDRHFSYMKLMKAATYAERPGAIFVGTCYDHRAPYEMKDRVMPCTGAYVAAVETVAGRPAVIMGKPYAEMFQAISQVHTVNPQRTIIVGDNCNTDIMFGKNNGLTTLLVLSGVTSKEDLEKLEKSDDVAAQRIIPDYYITSLAALSGLF